MWSFEPAETQEEEEKCSRYVCPMPRHHRRVSRPAKARAARHRVLSCRPCGGAARAPSLPLPPCDDALMCCVYEHADETHRAGPPPRAFLFPSPWLPPAACPRRPPRPPPSPHPLIHSPRGPAHALGLPLQTNHAPPRSKDAHNSFVFCAVVRLMPSPPLRRFAPSHFPPTARTTHAHRQAATLPATHTPPSNSPLVVVSPSSTASKKPAAAT